MLKERPNKPGNRPKPIEKFTSGWLLEYELFDSGGVLVAPGLGFDVRGSFELSFM